MMARKLRFCQEGGKIPQEKETLRKGRNVCLLPQKIHVEYIPLATNYLFLIFAGFYG